MPPSRRRDSGASLSIVHVAPGYTPGAGPPVVPEDVIKAHGVELLEHARKHAQATVPDLEVTTTLAAGHTTVHALADSSNDAALVVLGAERRSFASRVWTGDVVAGVAARSASPVAVVPPEWESAREHGRVVVGVKDPDVAGGIVAAGLSLADQLGAEFVIIHAWKAPSGYDDLFANPTSADDYGRRVTAVLEPMVQVHRAEHRAVPGPDRGAAQPGRARAGERLGGCRPAARLPSPRAVGPSTTSATSDAQSSTSRAVRWRCTQLVNHEHPSRDRRSLRRRSGLGARPPSSGPNPLLLAHTPRHSGGTQSRHSEVVRDGRVIRAQCPRM